MLVLTEEREASMMSMVGMQRKAEKERKMAHDQIRSKWGSPKEPGERQGERSWRS